MDFLRIFSASIFSSGKMSSFRNRMMESIQLGPALIWLIWTISPVLASLYKSSTRITRGKSYAEEVASITKESTYALPLLGTCSKSKESNFNCKYLTWLKYSWKSLKIPQYHWNHHNDQNTPKTYKMTKLLN